MIAFQDKCNSYLAGSRAGIKTIFVVRHQWLMPVILATLKAEIKGIPGLRLAHAKSSQEPHVNQ
jgi:hypothetical protein